MWADAHLKNLHKAMVNMMRKTYYTLGHLDKLTKINMEILDHQFLFTQSRS